MNKNKWLEDSVKRASYRAVFQKDISEDRIKQALQQCQIEMEKMQENHILLTASLYQYNKFLFLYTEGAGKVINPDKEFLSLKSFLQVWPAALEYPDTNRQWVYMQQYYYHAIPQNVKEWMQNRKPSLRCGRIALLTPEKWEEYMEYHFLLMREGIIEGDRYHFISIHENVLFSYFEEPKIIRNLKGKKEVQSLVLKKWLQTNPESHFTRFAPGQGFTSDQNFVFLPCLAGV